MNCLTMAIWIWLRRGCKGRIGILLWSDPFPHFAVFDGYWVTHYKADDQYLSWWKQLWFRGTVIHEWTGPSGELGE